MIKKANERYKERKIIENITINLPSQNPIAKIQYNNLKHNTSLINGSQTIIFAGTVYTYITPARTLSISRLKSRALKLSFLSLKMMVKSGLEFILKFTRDTC